MFDEVNDQYLSQSEKHKTMDFFMSNTITKTWIYA